MVPISVLDLAPITEGSNATEALARTLDLAQHAEAWGYRRYWLAEHHNMPGIASAATSVIIGYVAAGTKTIRVGAGGIMLPNHAPLVIAEQFGTLDALHPGRIDLGLGRAPGTDMRTAQALRRARDPGVESFPSDVLELRRYFGPLDPTAKVRAVPGAGANVPIWLLGSSLYSAELAGRLGLPFSFASHFAPDLLLPALDVYRRVFSPSDELEAPYVMLGANVIVADTDEEAARLATSLVQAFVRLARGAASQLPPPIDDLESFWTPQERAFVERALARSIVGSPDTVASKLLEFVDETKADEIIATAQVFDHAARLRSFELLASVRDRSA
jgi:luciferase family oxidoreductase group 1